MKNDGRDDRVEIAVGRVASEGLESEREFSESSSKSTVVWLVAVRSLKVSFRDSFLRLFVKLLIGFAVSMYLIVLTVFFHALGKR